MDTAVEREIVLFKSQMRLTNEGFGLRGSRSLISWALWCGSLTGSMAGVAEVSWGTSMRRVYLRLLKNRCKP